MRMRTGLPTLPLNNTENNNPRSMSISQVSPLLGTLTANGSRINPPGQHCSTTPCHLYTVLRAIMLSLLLSSLLISTSGRFLNCLFVSNPASYCLRLRVVIDENTETPVSLNIGWAMQQPANNAHLLLTHGFSMVEIIPWHFWKICRRYC